MSNVFISMGARGKLGGRGYVAVPVLGGVLLASIELNISSTTELFVPTSPCCGITKCSGVGWDINHTLTPYRQNEQTLNGCGTEESYHHLITKCEEGLGNMS